MSLTQSEVEQLLEATDSTEQRIALALGAQCGLLRPLADLGSITLAADAQGQSASVFVYP